MFISDISVKRPVFATVISLLILAFGILSFRELPLREYPDTSPPRVSVSTGYRGASAQVIETKVTQLIEDQISGIEGVESISSSSRDGSSRISVEFSIDRDIDQAANDIRDRVARVVNLNRTIESLKEIGVSVIGLDANGDVEYTQADFTGPVLIVVGSEGKGMSRLVRENCDQIASIPMAGKLSSLNASVSAGIVLYEAFRQRQEKASPG